MQASPRRGDPFLGRVASVYRRTQRTQEVAQGVIGAARSGRDQLAIEQGGHLQRLMVTGAVHARR